MNHRLESTLNHCAVAASTRNQWVYFVACNDFVKIGIAWDVRERLRMMQTGCPYELRLIHTFESGNALQSERDLHAKYGEYWHRGEWFKLPKEVIDKLVIESSKLETPAIRRQQRVVSEIAVRRALAAAILARPVVHRPKITPLDLPVCIGLGTLFTK